MNRRFRPVYSAVLLFGCLFSVAYPAHAQSWTDRFRDPDDGGIDLSEWLASGRGFMPMVGLITEPAVGYGGYAVPVFLHRPDGWSLEGAREAFRTGQRQPPPSVSAPFGMLTQNGSWAVGGGHLGIWKGDRIRYVGGAGYGSFELGVEGVGPGFENRTLDYQLRGWGILQSVAYRIQDLDLFLGLEYRIVGITSTFKNPNPDPILVIPGSSARTAGLGGSISYDSRNNIFTPDRGLNTKLQVNRQDNIFGGEMDYWSGSAYGLGYVQPWAPLVLGLRLDGRFSQDSAPFWDLPSVQMRGVPMKKYIGHQVGIVEGEIRWDFKPRWSLVGFGGMGFTAYEARGEESSHRVDAGGFGFRYLLARAFGLRSGIDVGYGPDGWTWYMTFGSAWMRF